MYTLLIAVGILFIMLKVKGCDSPPTAPKITPIESRAATAADNEGLPPGVRAKKVTPLGEVPTNTPGKIAELELIEGENGELFKKKTEKSKFGLYFQTKFYTGFDGNMTAGVAQEFFVYDRFSLNALIGFPSIGIGIEGLLTKNFGIIGGATFNYLDYGQISDLDTYSEGSFSAKPFLGIAFNF